MALWKEPTAPKRDSALLTPEPAAAREEFTPTKASTAWENGRRVPADMKESIIGSALTIEGKIEGAGHVRIAGRFKGDVHVEGNLTIEQGAKVTGGIKAGSVIIAGELDGNVLGAATVELLVTGVLNGDVKAGTLTVAAGSRMRGRVEFGWDGHELPHHSNGAGDGENGSAL